jgi:hypothetical protein
MYGNNDIGCNTIVKEFVRSRVEAYVGVDNEAVKAAFNYDGWGVMFSCHDWKWYDSYPDIQFLEQLFGEFDEVFIGDKGHESGYALEYVRVGEETEDIEERHLGSIEGRTWVSRTIEVDGN